MKLNKKYACLQILIQYVEGLNESLISLLLRLPLKNNID